MSEYSQGIAFDMAAILKDGLPITIDEIVSALNGTSELKARVARLEEAITILLSATEKLEYEGGWMFKAVEIAEDILNEPPAQSLAAIHADAVGEFAADLKGADWEDDELSRFAVDYIKHVRNGAKDGEA